MKTALAAIAFLIPFTLFTAQHSGAQPPADDFRVKVSSGGETIGYAYVLVNGGFHAMADSAGMTRIPARKLRLGDTLSARFVGMEGVPLVWDGTVAAGSVIGLELIPNTIDEVVVTARDRSKRYFRRYVEKIPTRGWYTGFRGGYTMQLHGKRPWKSRGTFDRNHIPGVEVNYWGIDTFTLNPESAADSVLGWQAQQYILLVKGISERAVQLDGYDSNKGMVMKYRGRTDGRNVFLIIKPYFATLQGAGESFQTLIYVNEASGIVSFAETVSQTKYGIWNVSASYAVYLSPDRSHHFIYPTQIEGRYEEDDPSADDTISVDISLTGIEAYSFPSVPDLQQYRIATDTKPTY